MFLLHKLKEKTEIDITLKFETIQHIFLFCFDGL